MVCQKNTNNCLMFPLTESYCLYSYQQLSSLCNEGRAPNGIVIILFCYYFYLFFYILLFYFVITVIYFIIILGSCLKSHTCVGSVPYFQFHIFRIRVCTLNLAKIVTKTFITSLTSIRVNKVRQKMPRFLLMRWSFFSEQVEIGLRLLQLWQNSIILK